MYLKFLAISLCVIAALQSSGCQNVQTNTKFIANVFNVSINIQKKLIDKYALQEVVVQKNISYMQQPTLMLDIYQPKNLLRLGLRPTILWVHGGGWVSGSKEHAGGYFKQLAAQGYNVVAVEYQLAPRAIYPSQLLQINQALNFITQYAKDYDINPEQIYLAGDSAGANLVSHYAALITNPDFAQQVGIVPSIRSEQIKGLILHCGIYDMKAFVSAANELKLVRWSLVNLVQSYTGNKKDDAEFLKSISPIEHLTENYPPVLISGGNKDFLTKNQSIPFVQALLKHKVAVTEVFYPDSKEFLLHEYQFMLHKKASQQTFKQTIQFIQKYSASL